MKLCTEVWTLLKTASMTYCKFKKNFVRKSTLFSNTIEIGQRDVEVDEELLYTGSQVPTSNRHTSVTWPDIGKHRKWLRHY